MEALLLALIDGLRHMLGYHVGPLCIFLPNQAIAPLLFKLSKHTYLQLSSDIILLVVNFVDFSPDLYMEFHWFLVKWAHIPGHNMLCHLGEDATSTSSPPLLPLSLARMPPSRARSMTTTTFHRLFTLPTSPLTNPTATTPHLTHLDF